MTDLPALERRIARAAPDTIVHLAASPDTGESGPALDPNTVLSTANLVKSIHSSSCRVIHVGSYKQYGDVPLPFRETVPTKPATAYGYSKQLAEELLVAADQSGRIRLTALRLGPVVGPGQSANSLLARLIEACEVESAVLTVGIKPWDPLYIDDAVDALAAVVHSGRRVDGSLNVSGGVQTTPLRVAELVGAQFGLSTERVRDRMFVSRDVGWNCLGDITRMVATTGWFPKYSHEDAVRLTVEASRQAQATVPALSSSVEPRATEVGCSR